MFYSSLLALNSWRKAKLTFFQKRGDGRELPYVMTAASRGRHIGKLSATER